MNPMSKLVYYRVYKNNDLKEFDGLISKIWYDWLQENNCSHVEYWLEKGYTIEWYEYEK